MIHVLIADDQPRVRSAIRLLLEQQPEEYSIEEVNDAHELLDHVKNYCPNLLFLDWELPGFTPDKLLTQLRTSCPNLIIIALSSEPQIRQIALDAGVNDFVSKNDPPEYLLATINHSKNLDIKKREGN